MKRSVAAIAVLLGMMMSVGTSTSAMPGPEPPVTRSRDGTFQLLVQEESGLRWGTEVFAVLKVPERPYGMDGWDWGGRAGYSCGFFELIDGGASASLADDRVIAKVIVEKYGQGGDGDGDGLYSYINSRFVGGGREPCSVIGTVPGRQVISASPTEIARSMRPGIGAVEAMGHVVHIFQNGLLVGSLEVPHHEANEDVWWFRGDEPGELCLWYLESDTGEYGIVGRLSVVPTVSGVTASDSLVT